MRSEGDLRDARSSGCRSCEELVLELELVRLLRKLVLAQSDMRRSGNIVSCCGHTSSVPSGAEMGTSRAEGGAASSTGRAVEASLTSNVTLSLLGMGRDVLSSFARTADTGGPVARRAVRCTVCPRICCAGHALTDCSDVLTDEEVFLVHGLNGGRHHRRGKRRGESGVQGRGRGEGSGKGKTNPSMKPAVQHPPHRYTELNYASQIAERTQQACTMRSTVRHRERQAPESHQP